MFYEGNKKDEVKTKKQKRLIEVEVEVEMCYTILYFFFHCSSSEEPRVRRVQILFTFLFSYFSIVRKRLNARISFPFALRVIEMKPYVRVQVKSGFDGLLKRHIENPSRTLQSQIPLSYLLSFSPLPKEPLPLRRCI